MKLTMASIYSAFKTTTTTLTAVSATAQTITHAAEGMSSLSQAGALHAHHFRNVTKRRLDLTEQEYEDIAEQQAKIKIAKAILSVEDELEDPRLREIYDCISLRKPVTQLHAAE